MDNFSTEKQEVPIDEVKPNEWNPNVQDEEMFQKEVASIRKYGFLQPILVRRTDNGYEIVDGEHRWRALKELGYTKITVENLGMLSDEDAKVLTLMLNNVKGEDDPIKRGQLFKDLMSSFPQAFDFLPFSKDTVKFEVDLVEFNYDYERRALMVDEEQMEKLEKAVKGAKEKGQKMILVAIRASDMPQDDNKPSEKQNEEPTETQ